MTNEQRQQLLDEIHPLATLIGVAVWSYNGELWLSRTGSFHPGIRCPENLAAAKHALMHFAKNHDP